MIKVIIYEPLIEAEPIGDKGYNIRTTDGNSLLVIKVIIYEPLREAESIGDKGYNIRTTDRSRAYW